MSLTSAKYLSTKMSAKLREGSCDEGALVVYICTGEEVAGLEGGADWETTSKCQGLTDAWCYDFPKSLAAVLVVAPPILGR